MIRAVALVAALGLTGALAACGSSSDDASAPPTSTAPTATASAAASDSASPTASASPTEPAFNPCDNLDVAAISRALASPLKMTTGTASDPRCGLLPKKKGGPTFELSYLWFDGGLEAAWKTITDKPAGTITEPRIKGADATKLIVQRRKNGYVVSAFMQNGDLIQSLNGVALPPYDAHAMQRATTTILTELSAAAPQR